MQTIVPNCPKCDRAAVAPPRQGTSCLPYKCSACGNVFGLAPLLDPASLAKDNVAFVVAERLGDSIDAEQTHQALEALNGSIKEE